MQNKFDITGLTAVVTGGNGLLGTEYVKTLANAGTNVAVFDVCKKLNDELALFVKKGTVKLFRVDITKKDDIKNALNDIKEWKGIPQILINNAAMDSPPGANAEENKSFEDYSLESWQKVIDVNLTGTFLCCQVIGGAMARAGKGSIINISSVYGVVSPKQSMYEYRTKETGIPFVKPISYTTTKAGIIGMTKWLATYFANKGVRVNTLAPGGVFNDQDKTFVENYKQNVPMGRMAQKHEYNEAILFLASDASSYTTGSTLVVDGGWTAW